MNTEVTWIIAALAHDRKKTKSGLADALGVNPSAVTRLLHGERRLKYTEAKLAADYLGVALPGDFNETPVTENGFQDDTKPFDHQHLLAAPNSAPLFLTSAGDNGFWRLDKTSIIERKPRSPQLAGVSDAFGFYAPDSAMAPRFKIGEIAWVNPARPAAPGDDVLLIRASQYESGGMVFLCELCAVRDQLFVVRQYQSPEEKSFMRDEWIALHVFPRA